MTAPVALTSDQVAGFLQARHHLDRPVAAAALTAAVGPAGTQDAPPDGGALALAVRTRGLTPAGLAAALWKKKSLALVWSGRTARYLVPAGDAGLLSAGVV